MGRAAGERVMMGISETIRDRRSHRRERETPGVFGVNWLDKGGQSIYYPVDIIARQNPHRATIAIAQTNYNAAAAQSCP